MNGEIGIILFDGREIGGFMNWSLSVNLKQVSTSQFKSYEVESVEADAYPFWIKERLNGDPVDILFMKEVGDELRAVSRNRMRLILPEDYPLNSIVYQGLEMRNG